MVFGLKVSVADSFCDLLNSTKEKIKLFGPGFLEQRVKPGK